jgi:hypothetical protein
MSCHEFFLVEQEEFGILLITDCTSAINTLGQISTSQVSPMQPSRLSRPQRGSWPTPHLAA